MFKKVLSSPITQWSVGIFVCVGLLVGLYLSVSLLAFYTLIFIFSAIGCLFIYMDTGLIDNGIEVAVCMLLLLVAVFSAYQAFNIYQYNNAQAYSQYAATEAPWLNSHTTVYIANVTTAKVWSAPQCGAFGLSCPDVKNENITVAVPDGQILTYHYFCDYFTIGQQVKIQASPKMALHDKCKSCWFYKLGQ